MREMQAPIELHEAKAIHHAGRTRGIRYSFFGGLLATVAIDLVVVSIFPLLGVSADVSFSVIGNTAAGFFALLGITLPGGVALGLLVHYITGTALGVILGLALSYVGAFRVGSVRKGDGIGILYTELISLPLLALPPVILGMPASDAAQWFGISFVMHAVYGAVLGAIVSYGLLSATRAQHR